MNRRKPNTNLPITFERVDDETSPSNGTIYAIDSTGKTVGIAAIRSRKDGGGVTVWLCDPDKTPDDPGWLDWYSHVWNRDAAMYELLEGLKVPYEANYPKAIAV